MRLTSKLKKLWSYVPKRAAAVVVAVAGVAAAVTIPVMTGAWGPSRATFTMAHPANYVTFNSITDNPDVGDERNFLRVRDSDERYWGAGTTNGWTDTISNMQEGHTYDVRMYVHNNGVEDKYLAENVKAHINLPTAEDVYGKQFEVNGYLYASNAKPSEIWDNIVLKSDKAFHVKVVSAKYYNNVRTEATSGFDLGSEVYTAKGEGTGALLGFDQMNGYMNSCLKYSGYVLLKIQPVFEFVPAPSYDVAKSVDKTTANPGDTINYTITVKNTGNVDLTNVKVTDQLPAYYSSASEQVSSQNGSTGSIVKGGAITFNKLNVGETATIKISYKIKGADQLECGQTTIKNKATGTTDQDTTEDDNNNNEVTTTVTNDCPEPEPGYDVAKSVDKTTAKPGDTINYTITVKNTGNVELTNVKITDKLPAYYSEAKEQVSSQNGSTGSIVKDGAITFNKLNVGETAAIKISYKIKGENELVCGETKITNKVTSTTDQDKTEDDNNNNEVTTTVNRECLPSYDVAKSVDKTTANPGDTINYTITVKNTGSVELTNVKVVDKLPAYYSEAKEQVSSQNGSTGSIVKDGAITFNKLNVGETATIKISYKVKAESDLACGETKITNKVTSTTDQDETEDSNDNNEVTTTVNRDCTPGYDVIKTVDKTTASAGDKLTYTITVKNTGNVELTNVKVTDELPAYYSEVTEKVNAPSKSTGSIVKDGSVTIASMPVGSTATISIVYTIKDTDDLACGETKITNKVTSTTDQDKTEDDNNNNEVTTTVYNNCEYGYDLVKTVDKTTANPGDTLTYTLTFRNTGRLDVTNVTIKDVLPAGVAMEGEIKTEPKTDVTGDITGDGLVIAKVEAGKDVVITLTAKVNESVDSFQCGDNQLINTATATTDEDQTEDSNDNNSATTVVTRECTPSVPPTTPPQETTPPQTPTYTPTQIASTGAGETLGTMIGLAAIAAAITAYIRSRKYAADNQ